MSKRNKRLALIFNLIFYVVPIPIGIDLATSIVDKTTNMWSLFELLALYAAYWFVLVALKNEQDW